MREQDGVLGARELERFVHRDVEIGSVVEYAEPAEQSRPVFRIERVGEAEPRLEGAVKLLALGSIREVPRRVYGHE